MSKASSEAGRQAGRQRLTETAENSRDFKQSAGGNKKPNFELLMNPAWHSNPRQMQVELLIYLGICLVPALLLKSSNKWLKNE